MMRLLIDLWCNRNKVKRNNQRQNWIKHPSSKKQPAIAWWYWRKKRMRLSAQCCSFLPRLRIRLEYHLPHQLKQTINTKYCRKRQRQRLCSNKWWKRRARCPHNNWSSLFRRKITKTSLIRRWSDRHDKSRSQVPDQPRHPMPRKISTRPDWRSY